MDMSHSGRAERVYHRWRKSLGYCCNKIGRLAHSLVKGGDYMDKMKIITVIGQIIIWLIVIVCVFVFAPTAH